MLGDGDPGRRRRVAHMEGAMMKYAGLILPIARLVCVVGLAVSYGCPFHHHHHWPLIAAFLVSLVAFNVVAGVVLR